MYENHSGDHKYICNFNQMLNRIKYEVQLFCIVISFAPQRSIFISVPNLLFWPIGIFGNFACWPQKCVHSADNE